MNRIHLRFLIGAAVVGLLGVDTAEGSAQTTFTACRVPVVGVIYLLAAPADPCLDAAHVKFSWTEGGAPADGSITSAKIADGTIAAADVANGAITQAKLDAAVSFPLADGAVTTAKILDGTIAAVDHAAGSVTTTQILDGTIATADLANGAVTAAKLASGAVPGWKAGTYGLFTVGSAAGVYNMATLTLTAPAAGFLWLQSNGYCNVTTSPAAQLGIGWATAAAGAPSLPESVALFDGVNGQIPYSTSKVVAVSAGANTFYLNAHNYTGGGSFSCGGTNVAIFTPTQLS